MKRALALFFCYKFSTPKRDREPDGKLAYQSDSRSLFGAAKARSASGRPQSQMRSIWDVGAEFITKILEGRPRREASLAARSPKCGAFGTWSAEFITKLSRPPVGSSLTIRWPDIFTGRPRREASLAARSPKCGAIGTWGC